MLSVTIPLAEKKTSLPNQTLTGLLHKAHLKWNMHLSSIH